MESQFVVGQKVVCVDDRWPSLRGTANPLCSGTIYTVKEFVRSFGFDANLVWGEYLCVRLVETENPEKYGDEDDVGFLIARFSPVVARKTDISIFTDMLIKQHEPA